MPATSECWPQSRQSDTRRFTPVTEVTLQQEFEEAHERMWTAPRWPEDWFAYVTTRALRDQRVSRGKGSTATPEPSTDTRPWPPTWITDRDTKGQD